MDASTTLEHAAIASFVEAAVKKIIASMNAFGPIDAGLCTHRVGNLGSKIQADRKTTMPGAPIDLSMVNGNNVVTYKQVDEDDIRSYARDFFDVVRVLPDYDEVQAIILDSDGSVRHNRGSKTASMSGLPSLDPSMPYSWHDADPTPAVESDGPDGPDGPDESLQIDPPVILVPPTTDDMGNDLIASLRSAELELVKQSRMAWAKDTYTRLVQNNPHASALEMCLLFKSIEEPAISPGVVTAQEKIAQVRTDLVDSMKAFREACDAAEKVIADVNYAACGPNA